jgi:hypothetical protein
MALELGAVRPPGVVHVNRINATLKRVLLQQFAELVEGDPSEWRGHTVLSCLRSTVALLRIDSSG